MYHDGCPCTVNEIELFEPVSKQVVLETGTWVDVHPLNNVSSDGPIEFFISGSQEEMVDLTEMEMCVHAKIVSTTADAALKATDIIGPVNNWQHSMFSDIIVTAGGKVIEGGNHQYPYKAYFKNLFCHGEESKNTQLQTSCWFQDTAEKFNSGIADNKGFEKRQKLVETSKTVEMSGPVLLDFTQQQKYILANTDMTIKFNRSKAEFQTMILTGANQANKVTAVKVIIEKAVLYVRRIKALPSTMLTMEDQLNFKNAIYPIQRTEMITYTIGAGALSNIKANVFRGQMPKAIFIAMVRNDAYNGNYKLNPFHFEHFDVNEVGLYREGESIPHRPFTPDFNKGFFTREYKSLFHTLGMYNKNESMGITLNDFANGYGIFGFNLAPDLQIAGHAQLPMQGNLRIELGFKNVLEHTINVIVMGIFDGQLEITKQRNVNVDWKS